MSLTPMGNGRFQMADSKCPMADGRRKGPPMRVRMPVVASLLLFVVSGARGQELHTAAPGEVGLSAAKLDRLRPALQKLVDDGKIPGGVAVVTRRGKVAY